MIQISLRAVLIVAASLAIIGCGPTAGTAPLEVVTINQPPPIPADAGAVNRPDFHTVVSGETLGKIALDYGLDYQELALWNSLHNANVIEIGQRLRLRPRGVAPEVSIVQPSKLQPAIVGKSKEELDENTRSQVTRAQVGVGGSKPARPIAGINYPGAVKLPYTKQDEERLTNMASGAEQAVLVVRNDALSINAPSNRRDVNGQVWSWPVNGKIIAKYGENNKGIDIGGARGLPVYASSSGKVIYAGSGLTGYGNLVIIKHSNEYLSSYAHNSKIIVAEGEQVKIGEQIAEMGDSGAERVGLHFEIRRGSDTFDPQRFLPKNP